MLRKAGVALAFLAVPVAIVSAAVLLLLSANLLTLDRKGPHNAQT
jgi:hypothetical protein